MPAFVFLSGRECGGVGETSVYGVSFTLGEPVMVTDPFVVAKLRGNRFFREVARADADADGVVTEDEADAEEARKAARRAYAREYRARLKAA